MAHSGLTWVCSRCRRERAEGQPHVCKTAEERPPVPRCTCVRPQLILEGDATETCPDCRGVRHAGSGGEASPKATSAPAQAPASPVPPERLAPASTLDALASRLEDAVGAAQEQAAPGHLLCTAALEVAEVLRVLSATVPPGAPPAALGASTPEALDAAARRGYAEGLRVAAGVVRPSETHGQLAHPVRVALESAARALDVGAGVVASGRPWPPTARRGG